MFLGGMTLEAMLGQQRADLVGVGAGEFGRRGFTSLAGRCERTAEQDQERSQRAKPSPT